MYKVEVKQPENFTCFSKLLELKKKNHYSDNNFDSETQRKRSGSHNSKVADKMKRIERMNIQNKSPLIYNQVKRFGSNVETDYPLK
jgi:hypothetical protein